MKKLKQIEFLGSPQDLRESIVFVYIYFVPGSDPEIIEEYCFNIVNRKTQFNFITSWIKVNILEELASMNSVKAIMTVLPPEFRTGSVNTEGDVLHQSDQVRAEYYPSGYGVKVGVITDGVDSRASAQATGDLPPDNDGLWILQNNYGGDEGTALLEIIHDIAPQADLYFHDAGTNTGEFMDAADALLAAGCDIICDDVGWLLEPFFEHGPVAQYIQGLLTSRNDLIWTSACGNAGLSHNQGWYYPVTGYTDHDFSHGTGGPTYIALDMPAGSSVIVVAQWNDPWGAAVNDYDLWMYNTATSDWPAWSYNDQSGGYPYPLEYFFYEACEYWNGEFWFFVDKYDGDPRELEIYFYPQGCTIDQTWITPQDAIFGHPVLEGDTPGMMATGAVNWWDPDQPASYSSQGPVTHWYEETVTATIQYSSTLQTPSSAWASGVDITGAGGFSDPFYGTSAAAPHAAGAAALLRETIVSPVTSTLQTIIPSMIYSSTGETNWDEGLGWGVPQLFQGYQDNVGSPIDVTLLTPSIYLYGSTLQVNIVLGPEGSVNLFDIDGMEGWIGIQGDSGLRLGELTDYEIQSENCFSGTLELMDEDDFGGLNSYVYAGKIIDDEYEQYYYGAVSATTAPPSYILQDGLYNGDTNQLTLTVQVTGVSPITRAVLYQSCTLNEASVISGTLDIYDLNFNDLPNDQPLSDKLLCLFFNEDERTYNFNNPVNIPSPLRPENVRIEKSSVGESIVITWDPIPGCKYNIYTADQPYADPSTWVLEYTTEEQGQWWYNVPDTSNIPAKYFFVTAVRVLPGGE
ncbi:S8 family serine peptidase [Candidatus Cloacimonadota bacterium]